MFVSILKTRALILPKNITSNILRKIVPQKSLKLSNAWSNQGVRTLYSMYSLGVEGFLKQGSRWRHELCTTDEKTFVQKMVNMLEPTNDNETVHTEDLKRMISYCQLKKEHLDLVISLSQKYNNEIGELNLKPYSFGPVIMRLLYVHGAPDEALSKLLEPSLGNLFHQPSSYQIGMDLLYKQSRYGDVCQLMDHIATKDLFGIPNTCLVLALGADYHLNTDKSLDHSMSLLRRSTDARRHPPFKALGFAARLALNRGKPDVALEVLAISRSFNHFTINNIYVLTKARLDCMDEVLNLIRLRTLVDTPRSAASLAKPVFCCDVISEVEKLMNEKTDLELKEKFAHLKSVLENMNLITEETIDTSLCSPVEDYFPAADLNRHSNRRYTKRTDSNYNN